MKDNSKNKEWERRRRDRLNEAFKKLAQILPNYDPAKIPPKIDILEKATQFVKELRLSNSRLISQQSQNDEKSKLINELQDEANKLILRVKQLTTLLKQAKIRIPLGPSLKMLGKKPGKWSQQLTPENVENSANGTAVDSNSKSGTTKILELTGEKTTSDSISQSLNAQNKANSATNTGGTPLKEANSEKESIPPLAIPKITSTRIDPSTVKPIQLPTTIILTSCPIPNPLAQPIVTRMTIAQRILPKPSSGSQLQKIAILPIRKPLPPKEKKRRNRKKKVKSTPEAISKTTASAVPPEQDSISTSAASISTPKLTTASEKTSESPKISEIQKKAPEVIDLTDENSSKSSSTTSVEQMDDAAEKNCDKTPTTTASSVEKVVQSNITENNVVKPICDTQEKAMEKEIVIVQEKSIENLIEVPEVSGEEAEEILQTHLGDHLRASTSLHHEKDILSVAATEKVNEESGAVGESETVPSNDLQRIQLEAPLEEETIEPPTTGAVEVNPAESIREAEQTPMEIAETSEETVTNVTDKISECIARSIDLIDPPVEELMELGEDWGEAHSPKSPISPTQMFLSMFPLLPRESIVSASETPTSTCKNSIQFSAARSSFFIDAMLPDENSNNTATESHQTNTSNTFKSISTTQNKNSNASTNSSFSASTYNSLVGTTCLAVAPTPTPPRQEVSHFHNMDTLNFMTMPVTPLSKKSSSTNNNIPSNTIATHTTQSHHQSLQHQSDDHLHYKHHNFDPYSFHSQNTIPASQAHVSAGVGSHSNNSHPRKKLNHTENRNSASSSHTSSSTPTISTSQTSVSVPSISSCPTRPSVAPTSEAHIFQPAPSASFRNSSIPAPSPLPLPTPIPTNHYHHHYPYQHSTFHSSSSNNTTSINTAPENAKSNTIITSQHQSYQNSYGESSLSTHSQSINHNTQNTNQKQPKPQLFRPALSEFNMPARPHIHSHEPHSHNQSHNLPQQQSHNYSTDLATTRHPKSHSQTTNSSLPVSYPSIMHQPTSNSHQNYPLPPPVIQTQSSITTSQNKSHGSSTNAPKQRQYTHSAEQNTTTYPLLCAGQQQPDSHPPPQSSSTTNLSNTNTSKSRTQNQQQHHHRHQSSTSTKANSNNTGNSSNNASTTDNSFHLNFAADVPLTVPAHTPTSSRSRNTNLQPHSSIPLQLPPTIAPPHPIPDFATTAAMNFNQYHHDHHLHSTSNYLHPPRNSTITNSNAPQRATPFYLTEVHSSDSSLPVVPQIPHPSSNSNSSSNTNLQSQNNNSNTNKTNFNPSVVAPDYSQPSSSHHNKNYFLDHSQGHSLYQHSLNNVSQTHIHVEPPAPPSLVPVPPIYSHPIPTSQVTNRHHQNCNVPPAVHSTVSRQPQPQQPPPQHQQNKQHKQSNQNQQQTQSQPHYPVQQQSSNNNNNSNTVASNNSTISTCSANQQPQQRRQNASNTNVNSNNNSSNNNNTVVAQTNASSRPVNWMTDPPHRKPPVSNTFSVSKLVGNSSFVANNSYCAEALIRKNPDWNDFHFTPPTPIHPPQHAHPPAHAHTFVSYQNEQPGGYSNFAHQYPSNSNPTHFGHYDNMQHHHHHNHHLPTHATTSSVSNFNLSSIFPEINDKRSSTSNNNNANNSSANSQESRCNYYGGGKHK